MKRIILLAVISACGALGPQLPASAQGRTETRAEKPNILFVLIDDMGYADLGCYGNKEASTPEIDRMATEGIRFSQYYASAPICSPSRVAVITGQYPPRWEITSFIDSRARNRTRGMRDFLSLEAPSVARMLADAGYHTAHIGKWHLGGGRDVGDAPLITAYGFDESVTQFEGLGERYLATFDMLESGDSTRGLERWSAALGRGEVHWEKRYRVTGRFVDRAIAAIEHAKSAGKPFFINLWPDDVHTPLEPSPANRDDMSKRGLYLAVLAELDRELGRVFDYIRRDPALASNTLVVITSDNGPEPGAGSAGTLRGTKGSLYEGGIREPLIAWYPRGIPVAKRGTLNSKTVIAGIDLPPTFAALAGVKEKYPFDGIDVSGALLGRSTPERSLPVMWQRPPDRKVIRGDNQRDLAIREGDFKLLIDKDGTHAELYNLAVDENEADDLSAEHPELVKKLSKKLLSWYSTMPPMK